MATLLQCRSLMPHLKAEDRRRGHFRVAKGLTPSLIPIIFGLVLDATTASLGLGADVPASASAARLKVTLGNGTVSAEIAGTPLRRVMEEIGRLGGIEVRWTGAIGEEPISVAFADLPL